jgi:membrane protein
LSTATDSRTEPAPTGRPPSGPERFGRRQWIAVLRRTLKEFMADDCMGLAQQVAYSSLLAFFPAVAALLGLLGMFHLFDQVQSFLATVAPHGVIHFIEGLQRDTHGAQGIVPFVVGLVGATWAASGATGAVIKAVNRAYNRLETRPFWKVRGIAIVLVLANFVVLVGVLVLVIFGGPLGQAIADKAHLGGAFKLVWGILRWPITFAAILLFFALVYYLAPNREQRSWKWITPGSLVGGALWLLLSGLFALYASFSGSYSKTYGTLASGVILLLWLNYTAWAILFGAELNAELDRQADIDAAGGPNAGLVKPARRTS